jgi:hypothetical protein
MALKRTMIHAHPDDLATIKEAAARDGIPEAEIIREAIHREALRLRRRSTPLRLRRFNSGDPTLADRVDDILGEGFGGAE